MKKYLLCFITMLFVALLFLSGCANNKRLSQEDAATLIQQEYETLIGYDAEKKTQPISTIHDYFAIDILSVRREKDKYIVQCILSNQNVSKAFEILNSSTNEMTLNNYMQVLTEEITKQERIELETEMIVLVNEDGSYYVSFTDEQLDAAMGGLISYYMQIVEEVD